MYKYYRYEIQQAFQKTFYTIHVGWYKYSSFQYNCTYTNT